MTRLALVKALLAPICVGAIVLLLAHTLTYFDPLAFKRVDLLGAINIVVAIGVVFQMFKTIIVYYVSQPNGLRYIQELLKSNSRSKRHCGVLYVAWVAGDRFGPSLINSNIVEKQRAMWQHWLDTHLDNVAWMPDVARYVEEQSAGYHEEVSSVITHDS